MAEKKQLFPVFDVPDLAASQTPATEEQRYKASVYFDYETGDFRRDGAGKLAIAEGREAYMQWCVKVAVTERLAHLSYSSNIGTELYEALAQGDIEAVKSALERTITEALMVNPKTEYVRDFVFDYAGDQLRCTFTVKGRDWTEGRLSAYYTT